MHLQTLATVLFACGAIASPMLEKRKDCFSGGLLPRSPLPFPQAAGSTDDCTKFCLDNGTVAGSPVCTKAPASCRAACVRAAPGLPPMRWLFFVSAGLTASVVGRQHLWQPVEYALEIWRLMRLAQSCVFSVHLQTGAVHLSFLQHWIRAHCPKKLLVNNSTL
ncbi:hypothetical protein PoMZ_10745 [Pyricularia oryzae]|uniref:Secreted protein n=1 Tax=Pyricularia oryzae TaxID=318829 RepID=A0A4P7MYE9_PYROR|nr:hypothetical protein PoMZ_10745 [Pyricularia oryzae]